VAVLRVLREARERLGEKAPTMSFNNGLSLDEQLLGNVNELKMRGVVSFRLGGSDVRIIGQSEAAPTQLFFNQGLIEKHRQFLEQVAELSTIPLWIHDREDGRIMANPEIK